MEKSYFPIDETAARLAKTMNSFSDYKEGSATEQYKKQVDEAYSIADNVPEFAKEKAMYYAGVYAKKLADSMNKYYRIETMCPSVMITGGGNFPTRKKEKQNEARSRYWKEYEGLKAYLERLKNLTRAEAPTEPIQENTEATHEYFTVVENYEVDRLQLVFDGKPTDEIRKILKANGYKWSPRFTAWQRQLTDNARASVKRVEREIKAAM